MAFFSSRSLLNVAFGMLLASAPAALLANDDSSSDATGGFSQVVSSSEGVMIRVPVDAQGLENTDAAEMRVHVGPSISDSTSLPTAFESAVDASAQPQLSETDLNRDSSTGWRHWNNCGWQYNYYYNYRPTYCNYGSYYSYNYPTYYNYCGYRYYYYPRYY